MRLRRLEFAIIGITLAFACFMGGFFTGRSWSAVHITAVATQNEETNGVGIGISAGVSLQANEPAVQETQSNPTTPVEEVATAPLAPAPEEQDTIGAPRGGDGRININLASQSELTDLPGIGSVLASRIIDYRRQHGDFLRIEDIRNVSGIGEKRYEAIQDKITVG